MSLWGDSSWCGISLDQETGLLGIGSQGGWTGRSLCGTQVSGELRPGQPGPAVPKVALQAGDRTAQPALRLAMVPAWQSLFPAVLPRSLRDEHKALLPQDTE